MGTSYNPGLHILADLKTDALPLLSAGDPFKEELNRLIAACELHQIGEVFHNFDGGGFTGVICLTESHISIHTWPEFKKATLDIFLSNFQQVNDGKARFLLEGIVQFFKAEVEQLTEIKR